MRVISLDMATARSQIYNDSVIRQGENLASELQVTLSDEFIGYQYRILFQLNEQTPVVTGELVPVNDVLSYVLTNALTNDFGNLKVEIQAFDVDGYLMKTSVVYLKVQVSMDDSTPTVMPESYVPWYSLAVTESAKALEQATIAIQKALEASQSEINALESEQNANTSEANSLLYSQNAKTSETNAKSSETNAGSSETVTTQTMQDFLAMLGADVATLTNGKLTPSQIPSIAINDTFPVANTTKMLALTAQKGDVAIIVADDVVTDSYILATDDPTLLASWKKLGVSYVSEAGHAETATVSEDSVMINGHRVIVMTQSQYDVAVKDPETVYLVSGV